MEPMVWIVTRWDWGGGGDDRTLIRGVFAASEEARAVAEKEDEVTAYPVGRLVGESS